MSQTCENSYFDHFLEGCQIIGFDGRYLYINDAAAIQNRRPKEELLGLKYEDVWVGAEASEIGELIKQSLEKRIENSAVYRMIFPDGTPEWFSIYILPIKEGILLLSLDITECKVANIDLTYENEEKGKRAAELIIANKELDFQNEEKEKRASELIIVNEITNKRLQIIQAFSKIDRSIAGNLELNITLNIVLEQVKTQLSVDAVAVLLYNPHTQLLEYAAGIGFRSKEIEQSRLRLGEGYAGRAALERKTMGVADHLNHDSQYFRAQQLSKDDFVAYFGAPLIAKGQVNGVLEVYNRLPIAVDENWLEFLNVLTEQTAVAVDNASLYTELKSSNAQLFAAYEYTIEGWSHALDLRDKETEGHTQRVTEMTLKLARAAGITETELVHVRRGALLHDIGKMGVPDHILLKPDKLTDEEWVAMRKHPTFAFELLSPIEYLMPALDIPYCHHEKWDGSGYPRGLKGEQIPLVARLFSIVDVWDALLSDRPYRKGWSIERVIEHIKLLSGKDFDPKAVELFLRVIGEDAKKADLHVIQ